MNKKKLLQLVILAGGKGSRLKEITKKESKPMLKIIDKKTFLELLIENLSRYPIDKILILCGYKYKNIFKKFHNKKINRIKITCIKEKKPLGTAGALRNASNLLEDNFFMCNGDTYFDINILDLFISCKKEKAGIIALSNKNFGKRYLKINKNFVNGGIYYLNKKQILRKISKKVSSLENDIFPGLLKKSKLTYKKFNTDFLDIGIKRDLKRAKNYILKKKKKKTVLLDRDGVINHDYGYVGNIKRFKFKKKVINAIKLLNDNNFYVFVVSNQSGVGRGYYGEKSVTKINDYIKKKLKIEGAHIDQFYSAFYYALSKNKIYRKNKNLRKPDIGMFNLIKKSWRIDMKKVYMIGDKATDKKFAENSGIKYFDINKYQNLYSLINKKLN